MAGWDESREIVTHLCALDKASDTPAFPIPYTRVSKTVPNDDDSDAGLHTDLADCTGQHRSSKRERA
jgi:hypothetical protein